MIGLMSTFGGPSPFSAITKSGWMKSSVIPSFENNFSGLVFSSVLKWIDSKRLRPLSYVISQSMRTEMRLSFINFVMAFATCVPNV